MHSPALNSDSRAFLRWAILMSVPFICIRFMRIGQVFGELRSLEPGADGA